MGDIQGIVTLVIGIAGVLFVPVLVWATVIAGLYQIVRDKVREDVARPERSSPESKVAYKVKRPKKTPDRPSD